MVCNQSRTIIKMKIWNFLNGKKSKIGVILHTIWFILNLIFKDLTLESETVRGHYIIFIITGIGLGHKVIKNKSKIKRVVKKTIKSKNV